MSQKWRRLEPQMRHRGRQRLRLAAWAFAGATVFGSVISLRDDLPGQPLGIRLPISVAAGLLLGWGAAVAAPWPMPVAALIVTRRSQASGSRRPGLICIAIGATCIAGTLVEPITRRPGSWTSGIGAAILANLGTSIGLIAAGRADSGART